MGSFIFKCHNADTLWNGTVKFQSYRNETLQKQKWQKIHQYLIVISVYVMQAH